LGSLLRGGPDANRGRPAETADESLVVFAVAAMIAGVLAAIAPARRASRLNVLEALQYE